MAWAYYNEMEPFAAAWLRELITRGLIAPGEVDTRSIEDVQPDDLKGFTQCHFFAGIGGWSYALRLAGWDDNRPVWTGSCPCQPFSLAGKQKGFADSRHLWPQFARLIRDAAPPVIFGEQVASASDWLGIVRGDLDAMGYAVGTMPVEAASAGADHLRDRYWFVADKSGTRSLPGSQSRIYRGEEGPGPRHGEPERCGVLGHAPCKRQREPHDESDTISNCRETRYLSGGPGAYSGVGLAEPVSADQWRHSGNARSETVARSGETRQEDGNAAECSRASSFEWVIGADGKARRVKSGIRLLVNGFPARVDLLRGFGNAIDPRPAAAFIRAAEESMQETEA